MKLYICENTKSAKWRKGIPSEKKMSLAFAKKCICDFVGEKEQQMEIKISKNEYGKPYVREMRKNMPGKQKKAKIGLSVHFSLSHSENTMVCAVACFNIGADCQKRIPRKIGSLKKIAGRFYSGEENAFLDSKAEEEDYIDNFFSIWAKKEAYIKYTGKGLAEGLDTFSVASGSSQKNFAGEARFKRIYLKNSKKDDFYVYLCYDKKNRNILKTKYV